MELLLRGINPIPREALLKAVLTGLHLYLGVLISVRVFVGIKAW